MDVPSSIFFDDFSDPTTTFQDCFMEDTLNLSMMPPSPLKEEELKDMDDDPGKKRAEKSKRKVHDKQKNRQSAALCRQRRKQYIQKLEEKVTHMEHEIQCLKRKVHMYQEREKLKVVADCVNDNLYSYEDTRAEIYDKLERQLQAYEQIDPETEQDNASRAIIDIDETVKEIQVGFGGMGKHRKKNVAILIK